MIASTYSRPAVVRATLRGRAVEEANAKAVVETGDGAANRCQGHIQIDGRRTEVSKPGNGDQDLTIKLFLHIVTII